MVAFTSAADAVRAAVAMQQASRRPVAGERLAIRVGLNAGEALRDAVDYFGTSVVVARRLCDRAEAGQILCSDLVAGLLAGQSSFAFSEVGPIELKGVPRPVAVSEVGYEAQAPTGLAGWVPCVGRDAELAGAFPRETAYEHSALSPKGLGRRGALVRSCRELLGSVASFAGEGPGAGRAPSSEQTPDGTPFAAPRSSPRLSAGRPAWCSLPGPQPSPSLARPATEPAAS